METRTEKIPGPEHPITIEPAGQRIIVRVGDRVVADTTAALTLQRSGIQARALHPDHGRRPDDAAIQSDVDLLPVQGRRSYYSIAGPDRELEDAIWTYKHPYAGRGADRGPPGLLHRSGRDHRMREKTDAA